MEAVTRHLETQRSHLHARLRVLLGDGAHRAPVGTALRVALTRPLAESGLALLGPSAPEAPIVATGGQPGPHLLLLFCADEVAAAAEPGGSRAGLVAALAALAAVRAASGRLPLTVTLVCDQDRVLGSGSLAGLTLPPADWCLWDGGGYHEERTWLALGSHGLARIRLWTTGPGGPASFGALIVNPLWRLVWALAALKSADEEVLLPGFYGPVREPEERELEALAAAAPYLTAAATRQGGEPLLGLHGASLALVQAFSPAVSLVGLGVENGPPGSLPTVAWADLALSLVPRQTPEEIVSALLQYLPAQALGDVGVELLTGYPGLDTPVGHPLVELASRAYASLAEEPPLLLPYAEAPAPLQRLGHGGDMAALGIGTGRAPWARLEQRVEAQAHAIARLLLALSVRATAAPAGRR